MNKCETKIRKSESIETIIQSPLKKSIEFSFKQNSYEGKQDFPQRNSLNIIKKQGFMQNFQLKKQLKMRLNIQDGNISDYKVAFPKIVCKKIDSKNIKNNNNHPIEHSKDTMKKSMINKEQYEKRIERLKKKLDTAHKRQHEIENILEEYEVQENINIDESRRIQMKYRNLQQIYSTAEIENKNLGQRISKLEKDKENLTKKWIRSSSRINKKGFLHYKFR